MPVEAVVGANWGDEGKGKITDFLAGRADFVVRFQGGRNAGHTIINSYGKFVLHLLPSGVFHPDVTNILGTGVALDIPAFLEELDLLKKKGVPEPNVLVSDRAQVVMPFHVLFDQYEEERLGEAGFGSTRVGIAPFYADKYLKLGVQVADLYHPNRLRTRLEKSLTAKNVLLEHLYGKPRISVDDTMQDIMESAERFRPYVRDTSLLLFEALKQEKRILLEGQLGALRDPDHGIYPYPTSSSPLAGFGSVGAGVPPWAIKSVFAVTKAYSTCVGAGPFVTEIFDKEAEVLRNRGGDSGEYGATTGRPRRVGWFDAVATRYGCRLQGATEIALTMLDVLKYLDEIPVCTAYEIEAKTTRNFPTSPYLEEARPVYEYLPGWKSDLTQCRSFMDLPDRARQYIRRIEELAGVPVGWISVGPEREAIFRRS